MNESYLSSLIPGLKTSVPEANTALNNKDHQRIRNVFSLWFHNSVIEKEVTQNLQETAYQIDSDLMWVAVGLMGIARAYHVDANVQRRDNIITNFLLKEKVAEVESFYDRLSLSKLAPWSIEGNGIFWLGEVTQDTFRSFELLGKSQEANATLSDGIVLTRALIQNLALSSEILQTPDKNLPTEQLIAKKRYVGALSSLGVMYARRGRFVTNLADLSQGLRYAREASHYEYNAERLRTLAGWTFKGLTYSNNKSEQLTAIWEVIRAGLLIAHKKTLLFTNPK